MKRRIKISIIFLLLLAAVCMAALVFWIDPLVKTTLEDLGSSLLGTEVRIEGVSVKPFRGSIRAKGIRVGAPTGFSSPEILKVKEVLVQVKLRSLLAQTFVIRRIRIDQPELMLERNGESDNLRTLLQQLQAPAAPAKEKAPEDSRWIAVTELEILQPRIRFIQMEEGKPTVSISAESFSFRQSSASIEIRKLNIDNPPGYTSSHLLSVEQVVAVAYCPHIGSFRLEGIRIESPQLLREKGAVGDNLSVCRKLVVPFFKGYGSEDAVADEAQDGSAYSWVPSQVVVADGKLVSHNPWLPEAESTRTELAFRRFAVRPAEGIARIRQLVVANPRRFSHAHIVELEELQVGIDPSSFGQETLRILELQIIAPRFVYERRLRTDNFAEFQRNMLVFAGSADAPETAESEAPDADASPPKIIVDHLLVTDGRVTSKFSKLPSAPVALPTIERFDLGQAEGGASYATLTCEITGIIYQTILQSVAGLGGMATDALKGSGNLLLDAGGAVGNTALDAIKGVGDLFKAEE